MPRDKHSCLFHFSAFVLTGLVGFFSPLSVNAVEVEDPVILERALTDVGILLKAKASVGEQNAERMRSGYESQLGPEFVWRAMALILKDQSRWTKFSVRKLEVLSRVSRELSSLSSDPEFFKSPLHPLVGEQVADFLSRFPFPSHLQDSVAAMMDSGNFWTAREYPFLLEKIRNGNAGKRIKAILLVAPKLKAEQLEGLRAALSKQRKNIHAYSVLYRLNLAQPPQIATLVRMYADKFIGTVNRRTFSDEVVSTPQFMNEYEKLYSLTLDKLHQAYLNDDSWVIKAVNAVQATTQKDEQLDGARRAEYLEFFSRLKTSGFMRIVDSKEVFPGEDCSEMLR